MAGQSAHLSLAEARAMQTRIQCSCSHAETHGGHKSSPTGAKKPKVGSKTDPANAHNK